MITGGTFDKVYKETMGVLDFHHSHVQEILDFCKCQVNVSFETLMLKDSLDLTDHDRKMISDRISECSQKRVLITHGTDTMRETGLYLEGSITGKTVVLTGAMIPYSLSKSDALFNLGAALAFVQYLPSGIYIAMNGRCSRASHARKHKETGVFELLSPASASLPMKHNS